MKELLSTVYKRKSIRTYDKDLVLTKEALDNLKDYFTKLIPLVADIKYHLEIVARKDTSAKFGEYCLLFYSEEKPYHLLNAGYLLEQIDLYLASQNVGVCWYGMAYPQEKTYEGLKYIIMLAFGQSEPSSFRESINEFKRKSIDSIWSGSFPEEIKAIVRLAPSACNSQTWRFISTDEQVEVYRDPNVRSIIPKSRLAYFNSLDLGIVLCFLDIALDNYGYDFTRILINEKADNDLIEVARYKIKK